jgi:hypothetical protein
LINYLLVFIPRSFKTNKISQGIEKLTVKHFLIEEGNQKLKLIEYITKNLSTSVNVNSFIFRKYNSFDIIIPTKFKLEETLYGDNTGKTKIVDWLNLPIEIYHNDNQ